MVAFVQMALAQVSNVALGCVVLMVSVGVQPMETLVKLIRNVALVIVRLQKFFVAIHSST